jgi:hypothetical protein
LCIKAWGALESNKGCLLKGSWGRVSELHMNVLNRCIYDCWCNCPPNSPTFHHRPEKVSSNPWK